MAVDAVWGTATSAYNDERQRNQQRHLTDQQIRGNKELGRFNQQLALEMWDRTNYSAQRYQMEKAGLNPGLMYGMGGGGGATTHGGSAGNSVTGGVAASHSGEMGMAMQLGIQRAMAEAQIEATKASTEKTKVETDKLAGVDTQKTVAETQNIIQKTSNEEVNNKILQYERELKSIESNIEAMNQWEVIDQMRTETKKVSAELQSAVAKGEIDEQTAEATITQIRTNTIEQQLRIETQKAGLLKTAQDIEASKAGMTKISAEIEKMAADIRAGRNALQLDRQKVINDILRTDFQTSDPSQIKQWTQIIMEAAQTGAQIGIATKLLKK